MMECKPSSSQIVLWLCSSVSLLKNFHKLSLSAIKTDFPVYGKGGLELVIGNNQINTALISLTQGLNLV